MPSNPPSIFTPPSAGSPPAAAGAVFTPPSAGGPPDAPGAVFTPVGEEEAGDAIFITGALAGGGTPVVPPARVPANGTSGGKIQWGDEVSVTWCIWNGAPNNFWTLDINDEQGLWKSYDDVATPELCTTWVPNAIGVTGTPVITRGITPPPAIFTP